MNSRDATRAGVLLAAFGASKTEAQRSLDRFAQRVRQAFPGLPVRWAFTSGVVRQRLAEEGWKSDSVAKALNRMWHEKFTHVAVQSLHVAPGGEYDELRADALAMREQGRFAGVEVGEPLLADDVDIERAAKAMVRHLPRQRGPEEPVLLMGHGTRHEADERYQRLDTALQRRDAELHLATMDGEVTIQDILPRLTRQGRVWLAPFLAVAGRHVEKDMLGQDPESWKSVLEAAGLEPVPVLHGLAEYEGFIDIWIDHLRGAVQALGPGMWSPSGSLTDDHGLPPEPS